MIELVIAIAIVGVLAFVALTAHDRARLRAQVYQAVSEIGAMQNLIGQYFLDINRYPDSLADVGRGGVLDPWGRPYVYTNLTTAKGKGAARKDKKLNPINSDFDLYSVGKDGKSASPLTAATSWDDVVRGADGRFIGLGKDF